MISADFSQKLIRFLDWVKYNQLTINWSKTKLIFITKQRAIHPNSLVIDGWSVEVVDELELLGILIDHNLLFNKYVDRLKSSVNQRLYSIKKLFYLSLTLIRLMVTYFAACYKVFKACKKN